jgi:hypothetical protein
MQRAKIELVGFAVALIGLGTMAITRPKLIQSTVLRHYERHPLLAKLNWTLPMMRTTGYVLYLQIVGVVLILLALLLLALSIFIEPTQHLESMAILGFRAREIHRRSVILSPVDFSVAWTSETVACTAEKL